MRVPKLTARTFTALLATGAVVAATAGSAQAAMIHVEVGSPFGEALYSQRMTMDQSNGNIYFSSDDFEEQGVRILNMNGGAAAGGVPSPITPAETPHQATPNAALAFDNACYIQKLSGSACSSFDPSSGEIYVAAPAEHAVDKFRLNSGKWEYVCQFVGWGFTGTACYKNSSSGREAQPTETEFREPEGVAVDSEGNAYITNSGDADMTVYEFNSAGEEVAKLATTVAGEAGNVAVTNAGNIYVSPRANQNGAPGGQIVELKKIGPGTYEQQALTSASGGALAVDPQGNVYVGAEPFVHEFDSKLEKYEVIGESFLEPYGGSESFALEEARDYLVVLGSCPGCYNGQVHVFSPAVLVPDVALTKATPTGPTSMAIDGTVNPDNVAVTACEVLFYSQNYIGGHRAFEETRPCASLPPLGNSPEPVSTEFKGLVPKEVYFAQLTAFNANGKNRTPVSGPYLQPAAPPTIEEPSATGVTRTSAVLNGIINPENSETTYYAVFGTTSAYGATTAPLAGGTAPLAKNVQVKIQGLQPGTTYHYKLVAVNEGGQAETEDREFTTQATLPPSVSNVTVEGLEPGAALIAGVVDTNGLPGSYEIEFGPNTSYATRAIGEVVSRDERVTLNLIYLIPETTYHYKIIVRNQDGTAESADQTFTTPRYPLKIPQVLPQVSALIAPFPPEETATFYKEAPATKAKKCPKGKARKHGKCVRKKSRKSRKSRGRKHKK